MGSGKTAVAKELARDFGLAFLDMDNEIAKLAKMPVPMIFNNFGEGHFRCLEYTLCQNLGNQIDSPTVVATGGGVVLDSRNTEALKRLGVIIYLKASPVLLSQRLEGDASRPLLPLENKIGKISALLAERRGLYEKAADFTVNTEGRTPAKIAGIIKKEAEKWV